jgi:methylglutaconyl-CoA hydratase
LVNEVVQAEELDTAIDRLVTQLLSNGPNALGEIKNLFHQFAIGPIDVSIRELTAQTIARVRSTEEAKEGFRAFLDKRLPLWVEQ